ncbi:MAG TPA: hypothetical protein VFH58_08920 [Acidimicrobiales bacterium]|nr:hypothetical protein [Acidimicrobiales bacterium]
MDQEPHPYGALSDAQPGLPQQPPAVRRRRVPRVAIVAGITAFFGLGGAGLAFATGGGGGTPSASFSSASSSTSTSLPEKPHARFGWAGPGMGGMGMVGGGKVIHGEYTVQDGSTYRTVTVQSGQVTSVSSSSITVLSPDGVSETYQVEPTTVVDSQAGGISSVAAKDQVRLQGLLQSGKRTAANIVDVTKVGDSHQGFGMGHPHGPGTPPGPGTPAGPAQGATA